MQGLVLHGFLPFKDLPSEGEHTDSELPIKKKIVIKKTIKITKKPPTVVLCANCNVTKRCYCTAYFQNCLDAMWLYDELPLQFPVFLSFFPFIEEKKKNHTESLCNLLCCILNPPILLMSALHHETDTCFLLWANIPS